MQECATSSSTHTSGSITRSCGTLSGTRSRNSGAQSGRCLMTGPPDHPLPGFGARERLAPPTSPAPMPGRSQTPRHPLRSSRKPGGRPGPIVMRHRCRTTGFVRHKNALCVAQSFLWVMGVAQIPVWVTSVPQPPPGHGLCLSDRGFGIHETACGYQSIHNRSPSVMASRRGKA